MESPSSAISQAKNTNPFSKKMENSDKVVSKSRARTGALIDITNDSPIVGLAMGKLETPTSLMSKKWIVNPQSKDTRTPGSGEALLRCQVKNLLQKVEEDAEISKVSFGKNKQFLNFQGFLNSPMALNAPTPANTPQIGNILGSEAFRNVCLAGVTPSPVPEQLMMVSSDETVNGMKCEGNESEKDWITRSLFLDFSDKSDGSDSCSSVLTNEGDKKKASASEDDSSSGWSLQVNTSAKDDDDDDFVYIEDDDGGLVDELCEGFRKISVKGVKFEGKHTRIIYNSDGEIEGQEECGSWNKYSPSIVRLKGLPSPKGKHLRFPDN